MFGKKGKAEVKTTYTLIGYAEAIKLAKEFNEVLTATEKHALDVLKVIKDINTEVEKLEARTPKDALDESGIG